MTHARPTSPHTDPQLTRRAGLFVHVGSWVYLALMLVFLALAFKLVPRSVPDRIIGAITPPPGAILVASDLILPAIAILAFLIVIWLLYRMGKAVGRGIHTRTHNRGRAPVDRKAFVDSSTAAGADPAVAAHVFNHLRAHYSAGSSLHLEDRLCDDLYLDESEVLDLLTDLRRTCGRRKLLARVALPTTVRDVVTQLSQSPHQSIRQPVTRISA